MQGWGYFFLLKKIATKTDMNVKINIPKANIKFSASYVTTSGHLPSKEVFKTSPPFKERLRPLPTLLCSCMSQLYQFFRPGSTCIRSSILFSFKLCLLCRYPICSNFPFTPKALSNSISNLF